MTRDEIIELIDRNPPYSQIAERIFDTLYARGVLKVDEPDHSVSAKGGYQPVKGKLNPNPPSARSGVVSSNEPIKESQKSFNKENVIKDPRKFTVIVKGNKVLRCTNPEIEGSQCWPSRGEETVHVREVLPESEPDRKLFGCLRCGALFNDDLCPNCRKHTDFVNSRIEQPKEPSPEEKILELCLDLDSGNIEKKYRKETCGSCSSSGSTCSAFAGCECICHKSSVEITRLELHELLRGLAEYFSAKVGK